MAGLASILTATNILLLCFVVSHEVSESNGAGFKELASANSHQTGEFRVAFQNNDHLRHRNKRQTLGQGPPNFSARRSSFDDEKPFIPKINAPPPGSILTYDGKAISTSIGAFSIVPKSERRTPSINRNRPQYATYRGDLPPPIPDHVPSDLPQFKDSKSIVSNFPPGFN